MSGIESVSLFSLPPLQRERTKHQSTSQALQSELVELRVAYANQSKQVMGAPKLDWLSNPILSVPYYPTIVKLMLAGNVSQGGAGTTAGMW